MIDRTFNALARSATSFGTRRASFRALGAAGLGAAIAAPMAADAKKKKKNCQKKTKQKCSSQISQCETSTIDVCEGGQECLDALLPCCQLLANCNAGAAVTCIFDAVTMA